MKLTFTSKDGKAVTVEGDDKDMMTAEMETGEQDFVMLRFKPGTLNVALPQGTGAHVRLAGGGQ